MPATVLSFFWGSGMVAGIAFALYWSRQARLIANTPTSRLRAASQGFVQVAGTAREPFGQELVSPLSGARCVWWEYEVNARRDGDSTQWRRIASARSTQGFVLDDGTGRCQVIPDGANIITEDEETWYGNTPWPVPDVVRSGLLVFGDQNYCYRERRIRSHISIHVLGEFRTRRAREHWNLKTRMRELLTAWKKNHPALLARFDQNHDRKIDQMEWEQARNAARQEAAQEENQLADALPEQMLCKPKYGQPFIISTYPWRALIRRRWQQAMAAFAVSILCAFMLIRF